MSCEKVVRRRLIAVDRQYTGSIGKAVNSLRMGLVIGSVDRIVITQ
jgi:hypothetical protein